MEQRTIKFRVFSKGGGMVDIKPRDWGWLGENVINNPKEKRWVLMQFTGLRDRNGKEIYEGDIVKLNPALKEDMEREKDKTYEVVYITPSWMLNSKIGSFSQGGPAWWNASVEVIGNIYENPNLLK